MERQPVGFRHGRKVGMVADDRDQFAGKLALLPAQCEVVEAVLGLRDKHDDLRPARGRSHLHRHAQPGGKGAERRGIGRLGPRLGDPLDALKEDARLHVAVLVRMQDVAPAFEDPTRHAGHETGLVGAVQQGDERDGGGHGENVFGVRF